MSTVDQFSAGVRLCRAMHVGAAADGVEVFGTVCLDAEACRLIETLSERARVDDLAVKGVSVDPRTPRAHLGEVADIVWTFPVRGDSGEAFGATLDSLLGEAKWRQECPDAIYVWDRDAFIDSRTDPKWREWPFREYAAVVIFARLLSKLSEVQSHDTLTFLEPTRFDLELFYNQSDLELAEISCIRQFELELTPVEEDPHLVRRREIFLHQIEDSVRNVRLKARFSGVLSQLDDIYRRYRRDYDLYARKFSHEQAVIELDTKKSEYIDALNDAIQSISTKLLSVPFAYVIAAGQMSPEGGAKNDVIMAGATIFVVLMVLLVANQILTVQHIQKDIGNVEKEFSERVEKTALDTRIKQVKWRALWERVVLWVVIFVIVLVWVMSFDLYMSYLTVVPAK